MTAPFSGQGEAAVCARVAIALLRRTRRGLENKQLSPAILIGIATEELRGLQFRSLRSCLLSLNCWVLEGRHSKDWLTGVVYRDMMGYKLRRCLSESYKATRRDPRVTNRGVRVANTQHQSGETPRTPVLNNAPDMLPEKLLRETDEYDD